MSRRIEFLAIALASGLWATAAHAQLDILSGKKLTQPGGQPFTSRSDSPKFTLAAQILPAGGKSPFLSVTAESRPAGTSIR